MIAWGNLLAGLKAHPGGSDLAPPEAPRAAVAAIWSKDVAGVPRVLIIRRALRANDPWSGQLGLPGGRRDAEDRDPLETAIRETHEEVGLLLRRDALLCALPPRPARSARVTTPLWVHLYAFASEPFEPRPCAVEVAAARSVPLPELCAKERGGMHRVATSIGEREVPGIALDDGLLWGLTRELLGELLAPLGLPFPP